MKDKTNKRKHNNVTINPKSATVPIGGSRIAKTSTIPNIKAGILTSLSHQSAIHLIISKYLKLIPCSGLHIASFDQFYFSRL